MCVCVRESVSVCIPHFLSPGSLIKEKGECKITPFLLIMFNSHISHKGHCNNNKCEITLELVFSNLSYEILNIILMMWVPT